MTDPFSTRHNYRTDPPISVREDAPPGFRYSIIGLAEECDLGGAKFAVNMVRRGLGEPPSNDWSPDNQRQDAQALIEQCDWWRVYDIAEMIYSALKAKNPVLTPHEQFENGINDYCAMHGIGWKMSQGRFQVRGELAEDTFNQHVVEELVQSGKHTTANELKEAFKDLSKRPKPDVTGAVQHVGAAIERLSRELCGDPSLTLGDLMKRYPDLFPGAFRKLAEAIWGITSNKGRHLSEGDAPTINEAMLLVGVVSSLCSYILHEAKNDTAKTK